MGQVELEQERDGGSADLRGMVGARVIGQAIFQQVEQLRGLGMDV